MACSQWSSLDSFDVGSLLTREESSSRASPTSSPSTAPALTERMSACLWVVALVTSLVAPLAAASRHVVMAAAIGYPLPVFERFILPLRSHGYRGAVVLFVDERALPDAARLLCERHNVTTRALPGHSAGPRLAKAKGMSRYSGYREVCDDAHYDHCFASDFRDVVFQADPFVSLPRGAGLVLAQEYSAVSIGQCKHNSRWIRTCFGERVLAQIAAETIVCSGTIMGTPKGFRVLHERMRDTMRLTAERARCATLDGVDQGRFNYL